MLIERLGREIFHSPKTTIFWWEIFLVFFEDSDLKLYGKILMGDKLINPVVGVYVPVKKISCQGLDDHPPYSHLGGDFFGGWVFQAIIFRLSLRETVVVCTWR